MPIPPIKPFAEKNLGYVSRSGTAILAPGSSLLCYMARYEVAIPDSPTYQVWEEHLSPSSNQVGWNYSAKAETLEDAINKAEPGNCIVGP